MPIPFTCPHCGRSTLVDEQFAGQRGPCASCGQLVTVPFPSKLVAAPAAAAAGGTGIILGIVLAVLAGGGCIVALLVALLVPAISNVNQTSNRIKSSNNLKQIGLALHNYHSMYNQLPPPVVYDAAGQPLYSWRVVLLPMLEYDSLYQQFDKSKAWDAPENIHISNQMLSVFRAPGDDTTAANGTNYFVLVGNAALLGDGKQPVNFGAVTDGLSNTIAVYESRGIAGSWAAPIDPAMDQYNFTIGPGPGQFPPVYRTDLQVLLGDGSTRVLPDSTDAGTLQALFTRALGEVVSF